MGWRWYLYNETLDQYYDTGSGSLDNIQKDLKYVFEYLKWSLEHVLHYVSDEHTEINFSKIIYY